MRIMIMLLMVLLSSCKVNQKIVCSQIRSAKIKAMPICDISFEKNRCRCRCFNLTEYKIEKDDMCNWSDGSDFKSGNYNIQTCEGIAGFFVEKWSSEVGPKFKKLNNLYGNLCGE